MFVNKNGLFGHGQNILSRTNMILTELRADGQDYFQNRKNFAISRYSHEKGLSSQITIINTARQNRFE